MRYQITEQAAGMGARHRKPGALAAAWHCWPAFLARYYIRQTWDDMPGPRWVRLALVIICIAIPGPQDELILIGLTRVFRAWRARRDGQATTRTAWKGQAA